MGRATYTHPMGGGAKITKQGAGVGENPPVRLFRDFPVPEKVLFILSRLRGAGFRACVVGGAVRDICMGRTVEDWDISTEAAPGEIAGVFSDTQSFRLKHDTVTLVFGKETCEVTPFRDGKGPHGLERDLGRRDFTMNAMAWDPEPARLIDPWRGRGDIRDKVVRAVGRAEDRFREDPLRLLRAVRFAAVFKFRIEEQTFKAVRAMAPEIERVSPERIRDELMGILAAERPSRGFRLMRQSGLLKAVLPELQECHLKRQNDFHRYTVLRHTLECVDLVEPDPMLRVSALLHDVAKPRVRIKKGDRWSFPGHERASAELAGEIMQRLRCDNRFTERVVNLIRHHMIGYGPGWTDGAVRRLIRRVGVEDIFSLLAFRKADIRAHGTKDSKTGPLDELENRIRGLLEQKAVLGRADLAVDGRRVMEVLQLDPGPAVGGVLDCLLERVTDDPSLNREATLVRMMKQECGQTKKSPTRESSGENGRK